MWEWGGGGDLWGFPSRPHPSHQSAHSLTDAPTTEVSRKSDSGLLFIGNPPNSNNSRDYEMVSSVHPIVFSKFRILKVTITENRGFSYLKSLFLNKILQSQMWPEFLILCKTLSHNIFPLENNHSPQLCHLPPLVALRQLNCAMLVLNSWLLDYFWGREPRLYGEITDFLNLSVFSNFDLYSLLLGSYIDDIYHKKTL